MSATVTTTSAAPGKAAVAAETRGGPLLIPTPGRMHGPVVAALLRRTAVIFSAVWSVGLLLIVLDAPVGWRAFGVGLFLPGAGFLCHADIIGAVLFLITLGLFAGSMVFWLATGNIIAPSLIWLGSAGLAMLLAGQGIHRWVEAAVPGATVALVMVGLIGQRRAFNAARRRGEERNRYLAAVAPRPRDDDAEPAVGPELTAEDLAAARFILDLALQPLDRFDGFDWLDQFQTAAVRYQLNCCQYALAHLHYTRTPAFTGYLAEAQRNLIQKMLDKRIWKYWRIENLWGNLDPNPDPIPRDNIMLSGYLGLMLGFYESNTGDSRYDRSGAITFRWDEKRSFVYDHRTIAAAVHRNFARADLGMFPCEPNWVYTMCNLIGMNSLRIGDRLHGTTHSSDALGRFAEAMNSEFLTPDGRTTAIRSSRTGLTLPSFTSTMADGSSAWLLNPLLPEMAERAWVIVRRELVSLGADGEVTMRLRGWDKADVGNYRRGTDVSPHVQLMITSREMGDEKLYLALKAAADRKFEPANRDGVLRYMKASTLMNAFACLARFSREDALRDLVVKGLPPAWHRGPTLAEAPYPEVLVARAVTDGSGLDLVLRPGNGSGRVRLGFERLVPGRLYSLTGTGFTLVLGDAEGRGSAEVDLKDRLALRLAPAPRAVCSSSPSP